MKAPKVTVLMAVHNAESYLRQAVESILNQSFDDFELLIYDDASQDQSVEIVQSFKDSRIRTVLNPVNQGHPRVRNLCMQIARGEYIAVLDADDIAHRDRLRIQTDFLDRNRGISLVGSPYEIIDESGRVVGIQKLYSDELSIKWGLLLGNRFGHSTVMFRLNDVLAVGGYDGTLPFAADFELWVRLATRSRLANLAFPVTQYRVHSQNATHTVRSATKENTLAQIVAKSIQLHTGETVELDVAKALANDIQKPAPNRSVLKSAYETISRCMGRFIESAAANRRESQAIVNLAVHDLFRIANRNPGSLGLALTQSLWSVARYDPRSLVRKCYVATVANRMLPPRVMRAVNRIKRVSSTLHETPGQ